MFSPLHICYPQQDHTRTQSEKHDKSFKQLNEVIPFARDSNTRINTVICAINYINALKQIINVNDPNIWIDYSLLNQISLENSLLSYDSRFPEVFLEMVIIKNIPFSTFSLSQ